MIKNFITISLILDALKKENRGSGSASSPRMEEAPTFRAWQPGFVVAHKNDRATTYAIKSISDGNTCGYQSTIELVGVDDDTEKRSLRGGTLQSSYVFISRGTVPVTAEEATKTIRPMTIAIDTIRSIGPRTKNRPGTSVVLKDGGKYPCAEGYDDVMAMLAAASPADAPVISA